MITSPGDRQLFERLLGDGSKLGISIRYAAQERPGGIAEALIIGADYAADERVALALGDNVFYGAGFADCLDRAGRRQEGAAVFACEVEDPERFGVVELDGGGAPVRLIEKPAEPASNLAVTGLYFYDNQAIEIARSLEPSARGELEITDVNQAYLDRGQLRVETLPEDTRWLDTGTHESLLLASTEIMAFEKNHASLAGSIEETAFRMGLIDRGQLRALAEGLKGSDYGRLLLELAVQD